VWGVTKAEWIVALLYGPVRLLGATLRFEVEARCREYGGAGQPATIFVCWHNRLLMLPLLRRQVLGGRRVVALASPSGDGEILAQFVGKFGVSAVRGSSSRRGARAVAELIRELRGGAHVFITPDGPRGPRYRLNPGAVALAQATGASIVPVGVEVDRAWRLKSWDRFFIPRPFARVRLFLGAPVAVGATADAAAFEAERERVEAALRAVTVEE
jgi:lysophospholipid acyltransferase (LPLAT)-like uncharacterized protein